MKKVSVCKDGTIQRLNEMLEWLGGENVFLEIHKLFKDDML